MDRVWNDLITDNKYHRQYYRIIDRARERQLPAEYNEKHHIAMRCLNRSKDNPYGEGVKVPVTYNEHCLLHLLAIFMVPYKSEEHVLAIMALLATINPSLSGRKTQKRVVLHKWHIWFDVYCRKLKKMYGINWKDYKEIIRRRNNEGFITHAEIKLLLEKNSNNIERRMKSPPQPKIDAFSMPKIIVERRMKASSGPIVGPLPTPRNYG